MKNRATPGTAVMVPTNVEDDESEEGAAMFQYGGVIPEEETEAVKAKGLQVGHKNTGNALGAYVEFKII